MSNYLIIIELHSVNLLAATVESKFYCIDHALAMKLRDSHNTHFISSCL